VEFERVVAFRGVPKVERIGLVDVDVDRLAIIKDLNVLGGKIRRWAGSDVAFDGQRCVKFDRIKRHDGWQKVKRMATDHRAGVRRLIPEDELGHNK
jgi:hypothetical protein